MNPPTSTINEFNQINFESIFFGWFLFLTMIHISNHKWFILEFSIIEIDHQLSLWYIPYTQLFQNRSGKNSFQIWFDTEKKNKTKEYFESWKWWIWNWNGCPLILMCVWYGIDDKIENQWQKSERKRSRNQNKDNCTVALNGYKTCQIERTKKSEIETEKEKFSVTQTLEFCLIVVVVVVVLLMENPKR